MTPVSRPEPRLTLRRRLVWHLAGLVLWFTLSRLLYLTGLSLLSSYLIAAVIATVVMILVLKAMLRR